MTVGVIGLGLIGGSIALDVQAGGRRVLAWDGDDATLAAAERAGISAAGSVEDVARAADLVVVAVPPAHVGATIGQVVATGDVPVTDVASIRRPGALGLDDDLAPSWVGSHPMAGTERSGFAAAHRGLLVGAPWLLTPHDRVAPTALAATVELALGLQARPMVVDAVFHDEVVATLSHLPHLLAYGLHDAGQGMGEGLAAALAGPSFRDATRVAASSPDFWGDLLSRNRPAVVTAIARLVEWLSAAMEGDVAQLTERLEAARRHPGPRAVSGRAQVVPLDDMGTALPLLRAAGRAGRALTAVATVPGELAVTITDA